MIDMKLGIRVCRDTIFNDSRMTLGSYVKGPNNIIHREWDGKAGPWLLDGGFSHELHGSPFEGGFGLYSYAFHEGGLKGLTPPN